MIRFTNPHLTDFHGAIEPRLYPPMKKMTESTDNRNPLKPAWHIAFVG